MKAKIPSSILPLGAMAGGIFSVLVMASQGAVLMNMTFANGGADIPETGWDGTTATGGSLATGLVVSDGMKINGDFAGVAAADQFHVDNWQSPNTNPSFVSVVLGAQPGYTFDLNGPGASFATLVHQHPKNPPGDALLIFNQVELVIGSTSYGFQPYTPGGAAQLLSWDLSSAGLTGLTSATFKMYFTSTLGGAADPVQTNHGPEWALNDSAYVRVSGSVVPEPSQAILVFAGLGLVLFRRR